MPSSPVATERRAPPSRRRLRGGAPSECWPRTVRLLEACVHAAFLVLFVYRCVIAGQKYLEAKVTWAEEIRQGIKGSYYRRKKKMTT